MRFWNAGFLAMLLIPALLAPAQAADFQAGMEAYERGDTAAAMLEWEPLANQGHVEAQFYLGVMHAENAESYAEGVEWLRIAAEQGHAKAQYNLGVMYVQGRGVHKDFVQAHAWAVMAANQGLEIAVELKMSLENHMTAEQMTRAQDLRDALSHWVGGATGRQASWVADFQIGWEASTRGDFATAIDKWRPLAEQKFATLEFLMGAVYAASGNNEEAVKWYRKAAEQGYARAQNNLGSMYEDGRGVPPNDEEAAKWYFEAASRGLAEAQTNLGTMYAEGAGVPKDDVEAYVWLRIAAAQGDTLAEKARDIVAARMTTTETCNQAERLAEQYWKDYVLPFQNGSARPLGGLDGRCL